MQIKSIDGFLARCEAKGVEREVNLFMLQDDTLKVGDYVAVHISNAIQKMTEEEAMTAWKIYDEMLSAEQSIQKQINSSNAISKLVSKLKNKKNIWILSGAGISAPSGIPTYRDHKGKWQAGTPIQHDEFISRLSFRKHYWARSMIGWEHINNSRANTAHKAITTLQKNGLVSQIVTQNVDRLHSSAGSKDVIDLHGRLDQNVCLDCLQKSSRESYQIRLLEINTAFNNYANQILPDGDAKVDDFDMNTVNIPPCLNCGGILMPDVVFFGGIVPRHRVTKAFSTLEKSDCVLVIGTSLSVYSGFRFTKWAYENNLPLYAINQGKLRGAEFFDEILPLPCETALPSINKKLKLTTPPFINSYRIYNHQEEAIIQKENVMEKEFREVLEKTSDSIEKLEDKVEDFVEDFADDAVELWDDIKKNFAGVNDKLKTASKDIEQKTDEAELQAHLGTMEAHDKIDGIKESIEDFTQKVSNKAQTEIDTVALRAHLAKKEAEDFWEEKGPKITKDFNESSDKVKELSLEAATEIKDYFEKLAGLFSKKDVGAGDSIDVEHNEYTIRFLLMSDLNEAGGLL
ncbi:NAD-dependent protein deacetylase [Nymphon striatum]|nr:NAD-dependent protein deacetylase [Nymphon striatum]